VDRQDGRRRLRRLREGRGWSWTDEARAIQSMARCLGVSRLAHTTLASIRRTIARWESTSAATVPDDRYQWVLAHLFAIRDERIDLGPGSELARLLLALQAFGVAPERMAEIHDVVIAWAERQGRPALTMMSDRHLDDAEAVAEYRLTLAALSRRADITPFLQTHLSLAPLLEALQCAGTADSSPAVLTLAAQGFALAGRLAFELRDDETARAHYRTAMARADRLSDGWLSAAVRTSYAMVTMHHSGELDDAERLAHQAVRAAMKGSSDVARARALSVQAEIAARRGLVRPVGAALDLAQAHMERPQPDDPGGSGLDPARLAGFVGLCRLLTCHGDAVSHLERASAGVPATANPVQRAIILADLALGYVRQKSPEPEASVRQLHECADLVARTRGRVGMQRIRQVRRQLRPWDGTPFLNELDDHMYTALLG